MELPREISCGHCMNVSKMNPIGTVTVRSSLVEHSNWGTNYTLANCPACKKINIVSYTWVEEMDDEYKRNVFIDFYYPQESIRPLGLPDKILAAYNASEKVKTIDVNAYAILMRRLLEMVCIEKKCKNGTLALMLKELANRKEIPDKLYQIASGLKNFGNIGAHPGVGELTEEETSIVSSLCNAVLEYIYSAPYLVATAEEKLSKIKGAKK